MSPLFRIRACLAVCAVACCSLTAAQGLRVPVAVAPGAPQVPPGAANVGIALRLAAPAGDSIEILRLGRSGADRPWQVAEVARKNILNGAVTVHGPVGLESLLIIRIPGHDGYLLDGPFRWPHRPAAYSVPMRWRRTVRGGWARNGAAAPVWVSADLRADASEPWPRCVWTADARWECVGVPQDDGGVVVSSARADLVYALAIAGRAIGGIEEPPDAAASWGRLLIAAATGNPGERLANVTLETNRIEIPRARPQAIRVRTVPDTSVRVDRVASGAFWLTGSDVHPEAWVELGADGRAPSRLPLRQVSGEPPEFPLRVDLDPALTIAGKVTAGAGMPAPGTIVSLFRLVPDRTMPDKRPPRRLLVAEQVAEEDGSFRFVNLGMEKYELLALHGSLGRADRWVEPDGQDIELALQRPAQAIGRLLRGGSPAAGVPVRVVPDLAQFASSEDVTELTGGETRTDAEGRFVVALSPRGGGELRIGADTDPVRRVPLPPADPKLRLVDVGDVEMGSSSAVTFVLEGSEGCELMLAGPEGRAGLTVLSATRIGPAMFEARPPEPGRWMVIVRCGGRERAVVPPTVDIKPGSEEVTVRLSWPR